MLVIGVALGYEADRQLPAMKVNPWGLTIAAIAVLLVAIWRVFLGWDPPSRGDEAKRGLARAVGAAVIIVGLLGASLLLTVAQKLPIPHMVHVVDDPVPTYPMSLAGSATQSIDEFQVITELPGFVGHPTYKGEQLLVWWPWDQLTKLLSPIGIFHADFDSVHGDFPQLTLSGIVTIDKRRPAQILLMDLKGRGFKEAVRELAPYRPKVIRSGVLRDGSYELHVELIDLLKYLKHPS